MENERIAKMFELQKTAFDAAFNAMVRMQDQTVSSTRGFFEKMTVLPQEGLKTWEGWMSLYKQGQEDFKAVVDNGLGAWTSFVEGAPKKSTGK
ncbi:MAG: hypothetical protein JSW39_14770 [Desulfobacterales bacterium]|nr:MAG: hypothetical protein JSW39_14770 [Desulfobacterales bacterium]